jgi:DNA invertase Pin-like site-specific DNA recombinase
MPALANLRWWTNSKDQAVDLHLIDLGGSVIANGVSKMVFTILAAVAEGERERIRERIRDARRRAETAHLIRQCGAPPRAAEMAPANRELRSLRQRSAMSWPGSKAATSWWPRERSCSSKPVSWAWRGSSRSE